MKRYWQILSDKIGALSLRDRGLIFVMAAAVAGTLISTILLGPLFARQTLLLQEIKRKESQIAAIQAQMQSLVVSRGGDPNAPLRARIAELQQKLAAMNATVEERQKSLVPPHEMAALLEDILGRNRKLQLVSLRTLPVVSLWEEREAKVRAEAGPERSAGRGAAPQKEGWIYKHGVEITVQGGYLDLLQYLSSLESLPRQMFWSQASLKVGDHLAATLTLTLYTLSLDKTWLSV